MSPLRTKGLLLVLATIVAVAGTAAPGAAKKPKKASTPLPAVSTAVAPGYYLMSGHTIVSQSYQNVALCYKDLAKIKQQMVPGSDTLVCVHRTQ